MEELEVQDNTDILNDFGTHNIFFQQELQPPTASFVMNSCPTSTLSCENIILENQVKLMDELQIIKEVITTGMAKLLTQADRCVPDEKQHVLREQADEFTKISTLLEAQEFEKNLVEAPFKSEMVRKMSFLVGRNGKRFGQGWTCSYELIDAIFVRNFLTKCSWTGTSKKFEGKIPFCEFKNILNVFAEV